LICLLAAAPLAMASAESVLLQPNKIEKTFQITGSDIEVGFSVMNSSNHTVQIDSIQTSCGCSVAKWSKEPVLPGRKSEVSLRVKPENSPQTKSIYAAVLLEGDKHSYIFECVLMPAHEMILSTNTLSWNSEDLGSSKKVQLRIRGLMNPDATLSMTNARRFTVSEDISKGSEERVYEFTPKAISSESNIGVAILSVATPGKVLRRAIILKIEN